MKDKMHANCAGHWSTKGWLSTAQVRELRAAYARGEGGYRTLARRFAVSWITVRDIVKYRRRWVG